MYTITVERAWPRNAASQNARLPQTTKVRLARSAKLMIDAANGRYASNPLVNSSQIRPCTMRKGDDARAEASPGSRAETRVSAETSSTSSAGAQGEVMKLTNLRRTMGFS